MRRRTSTLAVVVALGGGCASDDSLGIAMSDSSFGDPITIAAGKDLTITNLDEADHTWTSSECRSIFKRPMCDEIGFDSGLLSQNGTFSYAFNEPGEYSFFCETHLNDRHDYRKPVAPLPEADALSAGLGGEAEGVEHHGVEMVHRMLGNLRAIWDANEPALVVTL